MRLTLEILRYLYRIYRDQVNKYKSIDMYAAMTVLHIQVPWEKNWPPWLLTVSSPWAHRELTVTKMVTASRDWAVIWAVIELWPSRDHTEDAVIELWPRRDWTVTSLWHLLAVTEPWSLGLEPWPPWSLWAHRELTVTIFFSWGTLRIVPQKSNTINHSELAELYQ